MQRKFTLKEASATLGIAHKTLRNQAGAGRLRAERVDTPRGPVWMVDEDEVERYRRESLRPRKDSENDGNAT